MISFWVTKSCIGFSGIKAFWDKRLSSAKARSDENQHKLMALISV